MLSRSDGLGWHGDTCRTFLCGDVDEKGKKLVESTKRAMDAAIAICKPGVNYWEIGRTIEAEAKKDGFTALDVTCTCCRTFSTSRTITEARWCAVRVPCGVDV